MGIRGKIACLVCSTLLPVTQVAASSSHNIEAIKNKIAQQAELFQVTAWQAGEDGEHAQSSLDWFRLTVNEKQVEVSSPYINLPQKKSAQQRCETLADLTLNPTAEKQKTDLASMINRATQFHIPRNITMNGVRFDIAPTVEGVYVKLICRYTVVGG